MESNTGDIWKRLCKSQRAMQMWLTGKIKSEVGVTKKDLRTDSDRELGGFA